MVLTLQRWSWLHHWCMHVKMSGTLLSAVLVHGQVTIIFVVSVCLSVCLFVCLFMQSFLSRLWSDFDQTWTYVICLGLVVSPRYRGCATPGGWVTPKKLVFLGVLGLKKLSHPTVLIGLSWFFGYIVEHTNTKILSSHFFAISILNQNYAVINYVISGFAKVMVERCGFHHWIAQRISWHEVVSIFLYLL